MCISLLDAFLSLHTVRYVDDVVAIAISSFAVVDAKTVFVATSLVGVASLLWMPPLDMYSLSLYLSDVDLSLLYASAVFFAI